MKSSRFYLDLSVDLRSVRDKSVHFRSWGYYLLYNTIITKKNKTQQKLTTHREKLPSDILFCQQPTAIITHAKFCDLSTMSILSVDRYVLLLNQLRAGIFLLDTVMAVGFSCSNMK